MYRPTIYVEKIDKDTTMVYHTWLPTSRCPNGLTDICKLVMNGVDGFNCHFMVVTIFVNVGRIADK